MDLREVDHAGRFLDGESRPDLDGLMVRHACGQLLRGLAAGASDVQVVGIQVRNASGEHKLVAAFADAMRQVAASAGPYSVGG